ncbi:MAG: acetyl-CoA carboxylase carboxyltransferase subunit, partial [Deltaproteobacteria bacterium]|nr:acetyl-CoA carboxylase carboxyltransferase subunit [Deltaproteobacteria bacterium]
PAAGGGAAAKADATEQAALDAQQSGGPYRVASTLGYDEVIDPRELRNVLLAGLRLAAGRLTSAKQPLARVGYLP